MVFETFQNYGNNRFSAAILANIGLRNSQADLGLDAAQFRVLYTLVWFDEVNDSVVNTEHGELVRGSDRPLVYSAPSTADALWRAPIRFLLKRHLAAGVLKTKTKYLYCLPTGNTQNLQRM